MAINSRNFRSAAVVVLCAGLLGSLASDAYAAHARCRPDGTRTVAATSVIRVYLKRGRYTNYMYACRYASGRSRRLGVHEEGELSSLLVNDVHIAGNYVAFISQTVTRESAAVDGRVLDTRTGQVIRHVQRGYQGQNELAWSSDAVVTERGSAAFMFLISNEDYSNRRRVVQIADGPDPAGSRIVAEGADIQPKSLELHGGLVTWGHVVSTPIA